ncbi:hypothetical protein C483_09584 [Natrialba hulunbeirensis JCM 10989]|uniref:Uncharacterized protein n=2 Tax=Natrialba hulunbeirensis TaxID=123783 RepID=L9ZZ34_9EURY|nr:hypothetical protein C483_09584 [Natrialba hulunbeirensis JCM 10989]
MPESMFIVFALTVIGGSLGAIHYTVVHVLLGKPFADEEGEQTGGTKPTDALAERGEGDD